MFYEFGFDMFRCFQCFCVFVQGFFDVVVVGYIILVDECGVIWQWMCQIGQDVFVGMVYFVGYLFMGLWVWICDLFFDIGLDVVIGKQSCIGFGDVIEEGLIFQFVCLEILEFFECVVVQLKMIISIENCNGFV